MRTRRLNDRFVKEEGKESTKFSRYKTRRPWEQPWLPGHRPWWWIEYHWTTCRIKVEVIFYLRPLSLSLSLALKSRCFASPFDLIRWNIFLHQWNSNPCCPEINVESSPFLFLNTQKWWPGDSKNKQPMNLSSLSHSASCRLIVWQHKLSNLRRMAECTIGCWMDMCIESITRTLEKTSEQIVVIAFFRLLIKKLKSLARFGSFSFTTSEGLFLFLKNPENCSKTINHPFIVDPNSKCDKRQKVWVCFGLFRLFETIPLTMRLLLKGARN